MSAAVPDLTAPRRARKLTVAERTLTSGLRVLAVRRGGVPLVELRLRVPFSGRAATHAARANLLAQTLLSGTASSSTVDLAIALQRIGGSLHVDSDPDRLLVTGNALAGGLPQLLDLLGEVLTGASYPADEVAGERARLVERLRMARSQPGVIAREALLHRLYGEHPYSLEIPATDAVAAVTAAQLRTLHRSRLLPAGSTLVLVGDVTPQRALDRVEAALSAWGGTGRAQIAPAVPPVVPGPVVLVDRPEAVQSNIRIAGPALPRQDGDYPAMQLANLVFGGYFSSRLVENIRGQGIHLLPALRYRALGGRVGLVLEADVATEVTAPALMEMRYELSRIATLPVGEEELASARQYAIGTLALSTATQAGLASMLTALLASGLGPEWLAAHSQRLAGVTVEQVREQAGYLAPRRLVTVIVGTRHTSVRELAKLDEVIAG